jgi:hypothetical protein
MSEQVGLPEIPEGVEPAKRRTTALHTQALAREQVERLGSEREAPDQDDPTTTRGQHTARERAVTERQERIDRALEALPALEAIKEQPRKLPAEWGERVKEPRVSTTDPNAPSSPPPAKHHKRRAQRALSTSLRAVLRPTSRDLRVRRTARQREILPSSG